MDNFDSKGAKGHKSPADLAGGNKSSAPKQSAHVYLANKFGDFEIKSAIPLGMSYIDQIDIPEGSSIKVKASFLIKTVDGTVILYVNEDGTLMIENHGAFVKLTPYDLIELTEIYRDEGEINNTVASIAQEGNSVELIPVLMPPVLNDTFLDPLLQIEQGVKLSTKVDGSSAQYSTLYTSNPEIAGFNTPFGEMGFIYASQSVWALRWGLRELNNFDPLENIKQILQEILEQNIEFHTAVHADQIETESITFNSNMSPIDPDEDFIVGPEDNTGEQQLGNKLSDAYDPDGDTVTMASIDGVSIDPSSAELSGLTVELVDSSFSDGDGAEFIISTDKGDAFVRIGEDGTETWSNPDNVFSDLQVGESIIINVDYKVSDGNGGFDTSHQTITIYGPINPPGYIEGGNVLGVIIEDVIIDAPNKHPAQDLGKTSNSLFNMLGGAIGNNGIIYIQSIGDLSVDFSGDSFSGDDFQVQQINPFEVQLLYKGDGGSEKSISGPISFPDYLLVGTIVINPNSGEAEFVKPDSQNVDHFWDSLSETGEESITITIKFTIADNVSSLNLVATVVILGNNDIEIVAIPDSYEFNAGEEFSIPSDEGKLQNDLGSDLEIISSSGAEIKLNGISNDDYSIEATTPSGDAIAEYEITTPYGNTTLTIWADGKEEIADTGIFYVLGKNDELIIKINYQIEDEVGNHADSYQEITITNPMILGSLPPTAANDFYTISHDEDLSTLPGTPSPVGTEESLLANDVTNSPYIPHDQLYVAGVGGDSLEDSDLTIVGPIFISSITVTDSGSSDGDSSTSDLIAEFTIITNTGTAVLSIFDTGEVILDNISNAFDGLAELEMLTLSFDYTVADNYGYDSATATINILGYGSITDVSESYEFMASSFICDFEGSSVPFGNLLENTDYTIPGTPDLSVVNISDPGVIVEDDYGNPIEGFSIKDIDDPGFWGSDVHVGIPTFFKVTSGIDDLYVLVNSDGTAFIKDDGLLKCLVHGTISINFDYYVQDALGHISSINSNAEIVIDGPECPIINVSPIDDDIQLPGCDNEVITDLEASFLVSALDPNCEENLPLLFHSDGASIMCGDEVISIDPFTATQDELAWGKDLGHGLILALNNGNELTLTANSDSLGILSAEEILKFSIKISIDSYDECAQCDDIIETINFKIIGGNDAPVLILTPYDDDIQLPGCDPCEDNQDLVAVYKISANDPDCDDEIEFTFEIEGFDTLTQSDLEAGVSLIGNNDLILKLITSDSGEMKLKLIASPDLFKSMGGDEEYILSVNVIASDGMCEDKEVAQFTIIGGNDAPVLTVTEVDKDIQLASCEESVPVDLIASYTISTMDRDVNDYVTLLFIFNGTSFYNGDDLVTIDPFTATQAELLDGKDLGHGLTLTLNGDELTLTADQSTITELGTVEHFYLDIKVIASDRECTDVQNIKFLIKGDEGDGDCCVKGIDENNHYYIEFYVNDHSSDDDKIYPSILVRITDNGDGSITINATIQEETGDLRGIFFDIVDETLIGSLSIIDPDEPPYFEQGDDSVVNLGNGANMNGLEGSDVGYDFGVKISEPGNDEIREYTFTIESSDRGLTLDDFSGVDFGVRTTSIEGYHEDSSKLLETVCIIDNSPIDGNEICPANGCANNILYENQALHIEGGLNLLGNAYDPNNDALHISDINEPTLSFSFTISTESPERPLTLDDVSNVDFGLVYEEDQITYTTCQFYTPDDCTACDYGYILNEVSPIDQ